MRTLRRNDMTARVELLPLIDVVFLLLTFFIYSLIVMVRAEILPVNLTPASQGEQATEGTSHAITIDAQGLVLLNRKPIEMTALAAELRKLAESDDSSTLFIAVESSDEKVNQLPIYIEVQQLAQESGLKKITYVW